MAFPPHAHRRQAGGPAGTDRSAPPVLLDARHRHGQVGTGGHEHRHVEGPVLAVPEHRLAAEQEDGPVVGVAHHELGHVPAAVGLAHRQRVPAGRGRRGSAGRGRPR
jgi:hypothetical protein